MRKPLFFSVFIISFFFGTIFYCPDLHGIQKPTWQGKIEKENGITTIKNPRESLYGDIIFELEENLSIGRRDEENYAFKRIRSIQVDKHGIIYVLDSGNFRIQVFDKKGKYLQTIGKRGKKPEEFENPQSMLVDESTGCMYVKDKYKSLVTFDLWGYYLWTTRIERISEIKDYNVDEDGNIIGVLRTESEVGSKNTISKIIRESVIRTNYIEHPYYRVKNKVRFSALDTCIGYEMYLARLDYKTLVCGCARNYKLYVFDNHGHALLNFEKDIKNAQSNENEIGRIRKLENYSKISKYFSILTDNQGRIYIQTNRTKGTFSDREIDLFSKDGYYIYKTILPKNTQVIKNGYLYTFDTKETILIKRFKIKNWDQIKMGISN